MSTFVLGPYFLASKYIYTATTGNGGPTGSSGVKAFPGFIARSNSTTLCELGGPVATTPLGNTRYENNSVFPLINTYAVDHPTSTGRDKYLAGGPTDATILRIYKGAKPSIASLTNLSSYDSNLLISFSIPAFSATNVASSGMRFLQNGTNAANEGYSPDINSTKTYDGFSMILGICPTYTAATANGVATWFWFGRNYSLTNLSDIAFVTGDIGSFGSGADLELHNTTIVSGDFYRSAGFKFEIPTIHNI